MTFDSYTDYENMMATLAASPLQQAQPVVPNVDFTVYQTPMSGMNYPGHLGSTFINRVRYLPMAGQAFVTIGNGNYLYPITQTGLANWMKSRSLGQWYNQHLKLR